MSEEHGDRRSDESLEEPAEAGAHRDREADNGDSAISPAIETEHVEGISHLNRILRAVRDISKLILTETDRLHILKEACNILVRERGFLYAWIIPDEEAGVAPSLIHTGIGEGEAEVIMDMIATGRLPNCVQEAVSSEYFVSSGEFEGKCSDYPLKGGRYDSQVSITSALRYKEKLYGYLSVSVPSEFGGSSEEVLLFREMADDIAFALYRLDLEEQRSSAEILLKESEERYRSLVEASTDAIFLETVHGDILDCNNRACEILGYSRDELVGMNIERLLPPDLADKLPELLLMQQESGGSFIEYHNVRKDGVSIPVEVSARSVETSRGKRIVAYARDTSERMKSEAALRKSEERFRVFMESVPAVIFLKDSDSRYIYINSYLMERHDPEGEWIGRATGDCIPGINGSMMMETDAITLRDGISISMEELPDRSGELKIYEVHKFRIGMGETPQIGGIALDITDRLQAENEQKRLEEQLLHTQKLESLGVLAGGIAHDFNNILMAVLGYADLALMDLSSGDPARFAIMEIGKAARNAADLARQMLAYSGRGSFVIENVSINDVIRDMTHLLEISISKNAIIKYHLAENLPLVKVDPTQVRQVIMNLITNASEAMEECSGVISVTTSAMECDAEYLSTAFLNEDLREGLYVYFEVADTGSGMDAETLSKIFDPFFTSKFTGRGLGLSAVLGIVRSHNGALKVYSEKGCGTSFKILLPACLETMVPEKDDLTSNVESWIPDSGTVLLVDDEENVRSVGKAMLERFGFKVVTACDGREALELFKADPDSISCVVLDLTMPHMDGNEAFRELRRIRPDVKVILSSGYNQQDVTGKFVGKKLAGFIQKPYRMGDLLEKLKEVLS